MADNVNLVLAELSQLILHDNAVLRETMGRIDFLLKDAIGLLNQNFIHANSQLNPQQGHPSPAGTIEQTQMDNAGESLVTLLNKALTLTNRINSMLNQTVRSLQVEDIVSQMVAKVCNRTLQVDAILMALSAELAESSEQLKVDFIDDLVQRLVELRTRPLDTSIQQTSLSAGEVEIF